MIRRTTKILQWEIKIFKLVFHVCKYSSASLCWQGIFIRNKEVPFYSLYSSTAPATDKIWTFGLPAYLSMNFNRCFCLSQQIIIKMTVCGAVFFRLILISTLVGWGTKFAFADYGVCQGKKLEQLAQFLGTDEVDKVGWLNFYLAFHASKSSKYT